MSGHPTTDAEAATTPLIPLLNTPAVDADDDSRPASQCCGGGSCSL
ncbi:hypothetical protein ACIPVB_14475 [Microbacterium sp. NPDC090007]